MTIKKLRFYAVKCGFKSHHPQADPGVPYRCACFFDLFDCMGTGGSSGTMLSWKKGRSHSMKRNKFNWIVFIILTVLMLTILLMDHLKVFPLVDKRKFL